MRGEAGAVSVESVVMPGEVVKKHAKVEPECRKCHDPFDKAGQDRLCLACHKEVAADLAGKRGYHGRAPEVSDRRCRTCHAEHKGRDGELVRLDRKQFDHRVTNRPLQGGHGKVQCEGCHEPGKRFREAPSRCNDCHGRKDPHVGTQGTACDTCHTEATWKTVRFDHGTASFRLEGRHREARCEGCHKTMRFKPTAGNCYACHDKHDKHQGSFGNACDSCHTARAWKGTEFDHSRKTKFPLRDRHARTSCAKCHRGGLAAAQTPTKCHECHERDDKHRGLLGPTCEQCHVPTEWRRATFEHDRKTRFPLRGRHAERRCPDCHRASVREEHLDTKCVSCHRDDDVHRGRQGPRCEKCHDERAWTREVLVDHDETPFPLTGAHARAACLRCHLSPVFRDVARECVRCHEEDAGGHCQQGRDCERCHDTSTFRVSRAPQ